MDRGVDTDNHETRSMSASVTNDYDVLIIGAGVSGIDAAYYMNEHCPSHTYAILERRASLGGTWDFFKYPGIRSDSDMYTFGFSWKIWKSAKPIAPAEDILQYLDEAAREQGILKRIKFNIDIRWAQWSSATQRWKLTTTTGAVYMCKMLFGCTGYYSYEKPHRPHFRGEENFKGLIVHPQNWTNEHDSQVAKKRVAVIGSGATAVTLIPNLAKTASHVTMVQRSPTYILARPEEDAMTQTINNWLPEYFAVQLNRWRHIIMQRLMFEYCTRYPEGAKKMILNGMFKHLKGAISRDEFDEHFTPKYNPWEQRLCLSPGGDFFKVFRENKGSIVTGSVKQFTNDGILMEGGNTVDADVIISATGLNMQQNFPFSTMEVLIDGEKYIPSTKLVYKGVMLSGVPNFAFIFGYTNASWTLKADIASLYFTKLVNYMAKNNKGIVCPRILTGVKPSDGDIWSLKSGYVSRAGPQMPKQGNKEPWIQYHNYFVDATKLWFGGIEDESLEFGPCIVNKGLSSRL
jgi:monooxygenase